MLLHVDTDSVIDHGFREMVFEWWDSGVDVTLALLIFFLFHDFS